MAYSGLLCHIKSILVQRYSFTWLSCAHFLVLKFSVCGSKRLLPIRQSHEEVDPSLGVSQEQETLDSVFMNHERVVVRYVAGLLSLKSTILFPFPELEAIFSSESTQVSCKVTMNSRSQTSLGQTTQHRMSVQASRTLGGTPPEYQGTLHD